MMLEHSSAIAAVAAPPKPERLQSSIRRDGERLIITAHQRSGKCGFLLLWQVGWTAGCVMLLSDFLNDPAIGNLVFLIPFWAAWFFVAALLVWMMAGREKLIVSPMSVQFIRSALITLKTIELPLEEVRGFRDRASQVTGNDTELYGIEVVSDGESVSFGHLLPDRERDWLVSQLNLILETLRDDRTSVPEPDSSIENHDTANEQERLDSPSSPGALVLTAAEVRDAPPLDSRWHRLDAVDALIFRQHGRLHVSGLLILLFINLFWNGIVAGFVLSMWGLMPGGELPVQGAMWWALFVFLIPFKVIGLAMILALVLALLDPFRQTDLRFEWNQIERESRWPLLRWRKHWRVSKLSRLELRWDSDDEATRQISLKPDEGGRRFALALVDANNDDVCVFDDMTSGEARWIAGVILMEHSHWF